MRTILHGVLLFLFFWLGFEIGRDQGTKEGFNSAIDVCEPYLQDKFQFVKVQLPRMK